MKKITLLCFAFFALSFTWHTSAQCDYTLEMNDSYGDGWNGGTMDVLVNGTVVLDDVTVASGSQETLPFTVIDGDEVTTMHVADGSFPSEMSYRILDNNGTEVGTGDPGTDISTPITAICQAALPAPECATNPMPVDTATDVPIGNVTFTWSAPATGATPTAYDLYAGDSAALEYGVIATVTTESAALTINAYETTLFWQIVPKNGTSEATGCPIWSFTTESAPPGDTFATAIPITPSPEGTGCTSGSEPFSYDFETQFTDSNMNTTCTAAGTGVDIFFTWTATSDALIWNDGAGNPGIGIWDANTMAEIACVNTYADVDFELSGWTIGQDLVIQVYDYDGSRVNPLSFCLEELMLPACPDVETLTVANITSTSADLGWTQAGANANWDIEYGVDGFTPTGTPTEDDVTTNPYMLTGLTDTTDYEFYVRADCGMDNTTLVGAWVGPFAFSTLAPPPANDDFVNAEPVACGATVTGSTDAATLDEDDAPDGTDTAADLDAPNVWYSFTGSGSPEIVSLSLCGSNYDTDLLIYTGTSGNLTIVADGYDECASNTASEASFESDGTSTYYITITGWNSTSTGTYEMIVSCVPAPPANDECADALPLVLGEEMAFDNTGATDSTNGSTCNPSGDVRDIWYSFVAPTSGMVTIDTSASHYAIFSDCSTIENCDTTATTGLTGGNTYYVAVTDDGTNRAPGAGTLTVSDTSLSTLDFDNELAFTYYPNPVKNTLTLNAQKNIQNVSVFNMLGQEVLRVAPNAIDSEVDMSALQSGTYFVRVAIENATKTIKVIKK